MKNFIKKSLNRKNLQWKKGFFLIMFLLGYSLFVSAQTTISGKVSDQEGNPLIGVTILVKGTTLGVVTNIEGEYTLQANEGDILQYSYVGYLSEERNVSSTETRMDVTLLPDLIGVEEIVVIGYGTQRKSDVTSAIVSVKSEDFNQGAVKDAGQLLQGKVAGLSITNPNGDPTGNVVISLRGVASLRGDASPLVLIDGIPGDLNTVAPQDIASVDVLKEGAATAIYGARGTGGVIIISTKKGKKNSPMSVEYSNYFSTERISKKPDILNADEYRDAINTGKVDKIDLHGSTNWLEEIMKVPYSQVHNISATGGSEKTTYAGSFSYEDKEGIMLTSGIKRYIGRFDVTHEFFDDKVSLNIGAVVHNSTSNQVAPGGAYLQALVMNPTASVYDSLGNYYEPDDFEAYNPVAALKEEHNEQINRLNRLYGNIKVMPLKGLSVNLLLSREQWNGVNGNYKTFKHQTTTINNYNGYASRRSESSRNDLLELTGQYTKSIQEHNISIVGGYTYDYNWYDKFEMKNNNFPLDIYEFYDLDQGYSAKDSVEVGLGREMSGERKSSTLIGTVARLNYNYAGKYYFQGSVRRDGSSKFGNNNKWGTFPSVQIAWKLSEESFMNDFGFINLLKIRAGWGKTGIIPDESYMSKTQLNFDRYIYYNGKYIRLLEPQNNPNPDLQWEEKFETNIGVDFALLQNRLSGSIDYYNRVSKNMLWYYDVPVPPYKTSTLLTNVGELENKGVEVMINAIPIQTNDFSWSSTFLYSKNKNKLVSLDGHGFVNNTSFVEIGGLGAPLWQATQRLTVGRSLGEFYTYRVADVDSTGKWLYYDDEGKIVKGTRLNDSSDLAYVGSGIPKFYLSWNNTFKYKGFDLSITSRGAFGHKILNQTRLYYENTQKTANFLRTALDPVYGEIVTEAPKYCDRYIEKGDYYKIDNITLGYTFSPGADNYIKKVRVYVSGSNLITITKYKGLDPEVTTELNYNWDIAPGLDPREKYPTTRSYTAGINIVF